MDRNSAIGIFDSGAGGISFLNEVRRLLPNEDYIYYADLRHAPYGEKREDEILSLTRRSCEFLYEKGVKAIVIACNTATSAAVVDMRENLNLPILSMEPAVKPALTVLDDGRVLTLATPATCAQPRYRRLLERLDAVDLTVSVGCAGLAALVDAQAKPQQIFDCLDAALSPCFGQSFDAVVLGCTHYIFIKDLIVSYCHARFSGRQVFFDGNQGTARYLRHVLNDAGLLRDSDKPGAVRFFSSGTPFQLKRLKTFYSGK